MDADGCWRVVQIILDRDTDTVITGTAKARPPNADKNNHEFGVSFGKFSVWQCKLANYTYISNVPQ